MTLSIDYLGGNRKPQKKHGRPISQKERTLLSGWVLEVVNVETQGGEPVILSQ